MVLCVPPSPRPQRFMVEGRTVRHWRHSDLRSDIRSMSSISTYMQVLMSTPANKTRGHGRGFLSILLIHKISQRNDWKYYACRSILLVKTLSRFLCKIMKKIYLSFAVFLSFEIAVLSSLCIKNCKSHQRFQYKRIGIDFPLHKNSLSDQSKVSSNTCCSNFLKCST